MLAFVLRGWLFHGALLYSLRARGSDGVACPMAKVNKTVRVGARNLRKEGKIAKAFKVALAEWEGGSTTLCVCPVKGRHSSWTLSTRSEPHVVLRNVDSAFASDMVSKWEMAFFSSALTVKVVAPLEVRLG